MMAGLPEAIATPILAFCASALLMPLMNRAALRFGFVDVPNARKIHSRPIPLLGGMAVYFGVTLTLAFRGTLDTRVALMMVASLLVMILGLVDDRLDLHSRYRLILQVAVAAGLSWLGVRFNFLPQVPFDVLNHALTIVFLVGAINALNCIDCADGSAGGTCVIVFGSLAAIAAANGRFFVCQAALAGAGAVLGFLLFNVPPARTFLGDTGSTFLGLMAGALAVMASRTPAGSGQIPVAPFVLLVPMFDIVWVHFRRYQAGIHSIRDLLSSTGKDHLPHRLMARGLTRLSCMLVVAGLSALAAGGAFALANGLWLPAVLAWVALVAILWHLEEDARVVIRPGDQVALFQVSKPEVALQPTLQHEEGVA